MMDPVVSFYTYWAKLLIYREGSTDSLHSTMILGIFRFRPEIIYYYIRDRTGYIGMSFLQITAIRTHQQLRRQISERERLRVTFINSIKSTLFYVCYGKCFINLNIAVLIIF